MVENPENESQNAENELQTPENTVIPELEQESNETLADASQKIISGLQEELAAQKDKYLRLYSEFDNFRKRTSREKVEMIQSANESLLRTLLPVLDDMERAEKAMQGKDDQEWAGIALVFAKFRKVLDQTGTKAMETPAGTVFNPDLHEAITQLPAPEESLKGKVIDTVEKGYLLNEKVIRFAKVVVGS